MMDETLPLSSSFDYDTDEANVGCRWENWLPRLENRFITINRGADQDTRRRAQLLHYAR